MCELVWVDECVFALESLLMLFYDYDITTSFCSPTNSRLEDKERTGWRAIDSRAPWGLLGCWACSSARSPARPLARLLCTQFHQSCHCVSLERRVLLRLQAGHDGLSALRVSERTADECGRRAADSSRPADLISTAGLRSQRDRGLNVMLILQQTNR